MQRSSLFFFSGEREKGGDVDFSFVGGPYTLSLSFSFFLSLCVCSAISKSPLQILSSIVIRVSPLSLDMLPKSYAWCSALTQAFVCKFVEEHSSVCIKSSIEAFTCKFSEERFSICLHLPGKEHRSVQMNLQSITTQVCRVNMELHVC